MIKKLMLGTALGALALTGALNSSAVAQTASSTTSSPAPLATPNPAQPGVTKPDIIGSQKPDQWLASKFSGTDVIGADDKKIGDVSDILFDKDGKIEAYVISVGCFLGVGAKSVALAPSAFQVVPGSNGGADKLKLSMSENALKQAQNFTAYTPPSTTTGMGSPNPTGGSMSSPAGSSSTGR